MATPLRGANTSGLKFHLVLSALDAPNNGDSDITTYNVQWDQGTNSTFVDLVGSTSDFTRTEYEITNGISSGGTDMFKVRAGNKYGLGEFSDIILVLKAASVPLKMEEQEVTAGSWTDLTGTVTDYTDTFYMLPGQSQGASFAFRVVPKNV